MIVFLILTVISVIAQFGVSINYDIADYLPEEAPSTEAIDLMAQQFDDSIPNATVMVSDVTLQEALEFKQQLILIDGVEQVTWLDDVIDLKTPIEMADQAIVESYYQDEYALFSLTIRAGDEVRVTDAIYELIGENNALAGEAVNTANQQNMAATETLYAAALLIPIMMIILILSTQSWVEPFFFLVAIGISVIINLGTNLLIGDISFITQSVAPILQMAVSLDYAIFLLHRFSDYRRDISDPELAMKLAMKRSFPVIFMSALTTFFGFIALSFMNFELGADLGFNLVKGIVLSFISVVVFLPALTLLFYKWIDQTKHKPIIPKVTKVGEKIVQWKMPSLILLSIVIVPAFLAQSQTDFVYGTGEQPETTRIGSDMAKIESVFGNHSYVVVLVPKGDLAKEEALVKHYEKLDQVTTVISYVNLVSRAIPMEFLDEAMIERFYSDHYSRMILQLNTRPEGDDTFHLIEMIQQAVSSLYGDDVHLLGESVTLYDLKDVVQKDNRFVNGLTILSIGLVLLFTFKSISYPVILLLAIQAAVWINLSVPYFTNSSLIFVGYLIVSTVQLAATIDYAILLTEAYKTRRKTMSAVKAMIQAIDETCFSIAISASILSIVGFILWLTSSNPIVSSIGLLLGRGALIAFVMVLFVLPALLILCDRIIERTTWKAKMGKEKL